MSRNESDVLVEAGERQADPVRIDEDSIPFLVVRGKVVSLERFLSRPVHARGTYRASHPEDLARFVARQRSPKGSAIAFHRWGRVTVFLDFHEGAEGPAWCHFRATCRCSYRRAAEALDNITVLRGKFEPTKL